jgi:hypothetical protein
VSSSQATEKSLKVFVTFVTPPLKCNKKKDPIIPTKHAAGKIIVSLHERN